MRLHPVLAALVLASAAVTADAADMSNNCRVDIRYLESRGSIFAVVQIDATWGALIDADMHLVVNGEEIKVQPVLTSTQLVVVTWVGSAGTTLLSCATVEGRNWITNELWLPAQTTDCVYRSSETGNGAPVRHLPARPDHTVPPSGTLARMNR